VRPCGACAIDTGGRLPLIDDDAFNVRATVAGAADIAGLEIELRPRLEAEAPDEADDKAASEAEEENGFDALRRRDQSRRVHLNASYGERKEKGKKKENRKRTRRDRDCRRSADP